MFECDVRLSADEVPFLLHDDHLDRTTDGCGPAAALDWQQLARLDAGGWHGIASRGETLPTLTAVLAFCQQHDCALNIELKPAPGSEARTGEVVARLLREHWKQARPPLLSSFRLAALEAARTAAPELPRALLLERACSGWLETAAALDCVAIIGERRMWTAENVTQARDARFQLAAYTVNDAGQARELQQLGVDVLITDAVDRFHPAVTA